MASIVGDAEQRGVTTAPDAHAVLADARGNSFMAQRTLRAGVVRVDARLQDFSFPTHSHEHLCIGLMQAGEYTSRYGLRRHRPRRGDVILVAPGEIHDGRPCGSLGRAYTMLEVDPDAFRQLCLDALGRDWLDFPNAVVRERPVTSALAAWLAALAGTSTRAERDASAMLLGALFLPERRQRFRPRVASDLAGRVRQYLQDRDVLHDAIGDLARDIGSSRYQLIRAFKQAFGLTPEDFRRQLRVQRARGLLGGSEPLAQIAAQAGFADQSHMTREFRRLTGMTPSIYRRALR